MIGNYNVYNALNISLTRVQLQIRPNVFSNNRLVKQLTAEKREGERQLYR